MSKKKSKKNPEITSILDQLKEKLGLGSVVTFSEDGERSFEDNVNTISTGSLGLNYALSNNSGAFGLPLGRIIEIFGKEQSGKTTLALHVIAEAQKYAQKQFEQKKTPFLKKCVFIDAEHSFNRELAENVGVKFSSDQFFLIEPETGEDAMDAMFDLCRSNQVDVIVLDSVAAMIPKEELEGEIQNRTIGLQARLMSKGLRQLVQMASQSNTMVIFINQVRVKIGGFSMPGMVQHVTTGGTALKFYSSVRLKVQKIRLLKDGDSVYGQTVRVEVKKSKISPPNTTTIFDIIFGKGIDMISELIELAVKYKLITQRGAFYYHQDPKQNIAQGKKNLIQILRKNKKLYNELNEQILVIMKSKTTKKIMELINDCIAKKVLIPSMDNKGEYIHKTEKLIYGNKKEIARILQDDLELRTGLKVEIAK